MQFADQTDWRIIQRNDSAAPGMQEWGICRLDRLERDARRDADGVEVRLEDSLHRKESRRDAVLADRGECVGSEADGGEMILLGRDVAVHAEGLADFECVEGARLAVQIEP